MYYKSNEEIANLKKIINFELEFSICSNEFSTDNIKHMFLIAEKLLIYAKIDITGSTEVLFEDE